MKHWTRLPKKWWLPHHWKCSKSSWMGIWATWSHGRCPRPCQGGWKRSLPAQTIVWFYEKCFGASSLLLCFELSEPCSHSDNADPPKISFQPWPSPVFTKSLLLPMFWGPLKRACVLLFLSPCLAISGRNLSSRRWKLSLPLISSNLTPALSNRHVLCRSLVPDSKEEPRGHSLTPPLSMVGWGGELEGKGKTCVLG